MGLKRTIWAFLLALCMVAATAIPCAAMAAPESYVVASWQEFLTCCREKDGAGVLREYVARGPLICRESVILKETADRVDLTALAGLRVSAGAVLTIDNPNLVIMGPPPVITVEAGGTLRLLRWNPLTPEAMPPGGIVVEIGGHLELSPDLYLPDGLIQDRNPIPEPEPVPDPAPEPVPDPIPDAVPEPLPEPEPEPEPALPSPPPALECTQWQLRPDGVTALWLQTEPYGLTEDSVTTLYLYRSTDGQNWSLRGTLTWNEETNCYASGAESHYIGWIKDGKAKVQYFEPTDRDTLYLYIEVVSPDRTVASQPYRFVPPEVLPPPPSNGGGHTGGTVSGGPGDDDGSSGNRGGVQGAFDRTGQQTQGNDQTGQATPAPVETHEPSILPTPMPTPELTEPPAPGNGQSSFSSGEIPTGSGTQYGSAAWDTPIPVGVTSSDTRPQELEKAADGQKAPLKNEPAESDGAETTPEELPAAIPAAAELPEQSGDEQDGAAVLELAAVSVPTDTNDGDRGIVAVSATVAVCGLAAAALLVRRKICRRRKS